MSMKGMLLVGHGSKLPYNKELIETTAAIIAGKTDEYLVKPGFMSINAPTVEEQLAAFRREDIDMLVVVPLFLARGIHIEQDIPRLLGLAPGVRTGEFQLNGKTVPLVYANPIGSDPLLAELMLKNASDAIAELKP
ncbi:MAG TPA: sirohydrochlorin nickelochelatase [Methanoculleus sp.]|jgi:sirohydrochlorin cobalto/nickelchelatase|uniref:sirohydrochlorin nickelochelatase n=1 Tax=Methanoculleus sp. TaxID=90427 RepID=UPI001B6E9443|nr:sirohydrochlorin nickelochelatase [Methanoculleus sp.]MBP7145574.1 sirohydrochlorin nickelochelatase [Methanoculleus sp.]HNT08378.1 sirohydrochlorin nickelochelatase [Methanoculleus sp.]HNV38635.1 sirohydrochlorin nickelochelatase [Methanoculleus sp.]HOC84896.1 sirohydrochlorin nickelochelatase [Methanoculleus sp.]HOF97136.1 sirohydrochlorin nickelochelatase [Methanoculleus sp.]